MFGDNADNSAPQTDAPQSDNSMMQSSPVIGVPSDSAVPASTTYVPDADAQPTTDAAAPVANGPTPANPDELLDIKRQALQQLSPLLGHLDQSPEEKFRTTMMLIQASDNDALLKQAYEAAQQITDEKTRAQALLDVVNEINYFTQQSDGQQ